MTATIADLIFEQALEMLQSGDGDLLDCDYQGFREIMFSEDDMKEAYRLFDRYRKFRGL